MLVCEVFASAADGLRAIEGDIVVGLARTTAHSARHTNGTVFRNHFVVCFVLFIPKTIKTIPFIITLLVFIRTLTERLIFTLTERLIFYLKSSVLKYLYVNYC